LLVTFKWEGEYHIEPPTLGAFDLEPGVLTMEQLEPVADIAKTDATVRHCTNDIGTALSVV
jgi:hypothetical protein